MKHAKKNNNKGLTIALGICIVLLTAVIIFMLVAVAGFGKQKPNDNPVPGVNDATGETGELVEQPEYTEPQETNAEDLQITTPYATLYYPGQWSGLLQVDQLSGDPYQVVFTAKLDSGITQELFTISFGGGMADSIGVVNVSGKDVAVHLSVQDIVPGDDWTDNEISVIYNMLECLNDVLAGLNLTTPQEEPVHNQTTLPPESDEAMTIDTPAGGLRYPARWKDYLKLEVRDEQAYAVEFYTDLEGFDPVLLFTIYLGGDQGIYVTDITAPDGSQVKLYVDFTEIEADINWTDAQKAIVFAMQEDINFLLSELN